MDLDSYYQATWIFTGKAVKRPVLIARANCRPAKEVFDQELALIASECISLDQCEPKIKSYHKFGCSFSVKETIDGIGLGCDIVTGSASFTRRSTDSEAGFNTPPGLIVTFMTAVMQALDSGGALIDPDFYVTEMGTGKICPAV